MRYSSPYRNIGLTAGAINRIRWGDSETVPVWGDIYKEIENPTAGSTYTLIELPEGMYYWCYGWHIASTNDCRVSVQDTLESRRYVKDLYSYNGRIFHVESRTPLFGYPQHITYGNNLELWVGTSFTGKIYVVVLGIANYKESIDEV